MRSMCILNDYSNLFVKHSGKSSVTFPGNKDNTNRLGRWEMGAQGQ